MADDAPPSFAELQARGVIPADPGAAPPAPAPQDAAPPPAAPEPQAAPAPAASSESGTTPALKTMQTAGIGDYYRSGDGRIYQKIKSPFDPSGQAAIGVLQTGDGGAAQHPKAQRLHIIADPVTITASRAPSTVVSQQPSATGPDLVVDAPRGVRNNNLGNLKPPPGLTYPGQTGLDAQGFAQFAHPQDGDNAAVANVQAYAKQHGINTVQDLVKRWAPDAKPYYAPMVAGALGVQPGDPVDFTNPQIAQKTAQAIFQAEGNQQPGQPGQGPPADDTPPSFAELQARGVIPPPAPAQAAAPGLPQQGPHPPGPVTGVGSFLNAQAANLSDILNTASFGGEHRLNALLSALPELAKAPGQGLTPFSQAFSQSMDRQQAAQPVGLAHTINTLTGGAAQALLLPEVKAATLAARAAVGAGQGAFLGGAQGIGEARGDLPQMLRAGLPAAAVGAATGGVLGGAFGARPAPPVAAASMADYARAGVDPMLAVNGPVWAQRMAQGISRLPLVGAPIAKRAGQMAGQIGAGVQRAAGQLGQAATPFQAGGAIQRGAESGLAAMRAASDALYRPVDAMLDKAKPVPVTRSQAAIKEAFEQFSTPAARAFVERRAPMLTELQKTLAGSGVLSRWGIGRLRPSELKAIRGEVGDLLKDRGLVSSSDERKLSQLYKAMTQDLHEGVTDQLGREAGGLMQRADAGWKVLRAREKDTLDTVLKKATREDAFSRVKAMMGSTSRGDLAQLKRLTDLIPDGARNEFAAGVINNIGHNAEGVFDPARFAREWGRMSPEAKRLVIRDPDTARDLDALFRVAQHHQQAATPLMRGASHGHGFAFGTGAFITEKLGEMLHEHGLTGLPALAAHNLPEALGALGAFGATGGGAKLLASPGFARLVMGAGQASEAADQQASLQALRAYAQAHPSLRGEVLTYTAELARRFKANVPVASGTATAEGVRQAAPGHNR
jgi:hypothetical protein